MENSQELGVNVVTDEFDSRHPWNKVFLGCYAIALARVPGLFVPELSIRDYLPEPFDVPDHIGNLSGMGLMLFPFMRGYTKADNERVMTQEEHKSHKRKLAFIVGGLAVAANTIGEVVGYGPASTPDPVDFGYGLIGAFLYYKAAQHRFVPESDLERMIDVGDRAEQEGITMRPYYSAIVSWAKDMKQKIAAHREAPQQKVEKPRKQVKLAETNRTAPANKRYTPAKKKK